MTADEQTEQRMNAGAKGPPVWLDLDQRELDEAYSQAIHAPNIGQVLARWAANSDSTRRRLGAPRRIRYGRDPIESVDVYQTDRAGAPVQIFIHGGAWREGRADVYGFLADVFVEAGVHLVLPEFSWVQDVGDSMFPLADQVRRAVAWTHRNAGEFGGDPDRIHVAGHSSGGHLAAVILTTDWGEFDLPSDVVKGGLCCSGTYDMEPVRLSARGDYIDFTDEMEDALSPIRHLDQLQAPLIVAYGGYESPEFIRQSREFAAAATAATNHSVELVVAENYNHFEVLETLANPYGIVGRAALEQIERGQIPLP